MKLGFIGLGKMGSQMVQQLTQAGHEVVATDHNPEAIDQAATNGAVPAANRDELVKKIGENPVVWLMIPAKFVDDEIDALLKLLPRDSIIVDGGNSDFRDTKARNERCKQAGVKLVDVGTSGGVLGIKQGFSMMAGSDDEAAFRSIEPIVKVMAAENGYQYFGPSGAGHYVKMIHNGIEYGIMEAYAEGYLLLKEGKDYPGLDLGGIAKVWQHGSIIASELNGLTQQILEKNPELEGASGYVAESGEGRWTLEVGKAQGIKMPAIQAALDDRLASERGEVNFGTKLLAEMRNAFGGHPLNKKEW